MKLPKIQTRHKIRDASICKLWVQDLLTIKEIAKRFSLSASRINTILYTNRGYIKSESGWEKSKRIVWLRRQIKSRGNSKKDSADLLQQLRVEIEGNTPLIDNSQHQHFTVKIKTDDKNDRSPVALQAEGSLGRISEE